jgi:hypothetical protein
MVLDKAAPAAGDEETAEEGVEAEPTPGNSIIVSCVSRAATDASSCATVDLD